MEKHNTVNIFHREIVTVNDVYSVMVNWAKQDMVLNNHEHELNYGNLIMIENIWELFLFQIYYSQMFNENMDKCNYI